MKEIIYLFVIGIILVFTACVGSETKSEDLVLEETVESITDDVIVSAKTGCQSGDCKNGFGTWVWDSGSKYVGDFKNDMCHGKGTYTWYNGDVYVGDYMYDKCHGEGTSTYANGMKYSGQFLEGKKHGKGLLTYPNGMKYIGEFKDDMFNGVGTLTLDGNSIKGIFKDNNYIGEQKID